MSNLQERLAANGLWIASAALVLAAGTAFSALSRALKIEGPPPVSPAELIAVPHVDLSPSAPITDLRTALDDDLFAPDRTASDTRYQLPNSATTGNSPVRESAPLPTVLGTVVATDGHSFATCAINGGPPKNVHVGDSVGPYVVRTIERGHVVFVAPSGRQVDVHSDQN